MLKFQILAEDPLFAALRPGLLWCLLDDQSAQTAVERGDRILHCGGICSSAVSDSLLRDWENSMPYQWSLRKEKMPDITCRPNGWNFEKSTQYSPLGAQHSSVWLV